MTKRLMGTLVCVLAIFAVGGVASAQAQGLPYKDAKVLAKRLANKQLRGRHVISYHLLRAIRSSSTRILFPYDDRTRDNVFCKSVIVVTRTVSGRITTTRAKFTATTCNGIPSEVLKFEALTRHAQRDLRANTAATVDAIDAVNRSAKQCKAVKVPRSKRTNAQALFDIALVEALERPNDAAVGSFVAGLVNATVSNTTLSNAAAAWSDWLAAVRALPTVDDPCAALKSWRAAGYASGSAPIDFAAYHALDRRTAVDRRAIEKAATFMANKGAFVNAAVGFTPEGLLLQKAASAGITGGASKAKPIIG
jgi:hypothetical protein